MLKTILKPSESVAIGVGIGAVDLWIFQSHLPATADIRTAQPANTDVETARRQATIMAVGINGFVSLITRDWTVFLIGGAVTAAMSILVAHANAVSPETGTMTQPGEAQAKSMDNTYPLADYGYQLANAG
jgi:hypothetical protein